MRADAPSLGGTFCAPQHDSFITGRLSMQSDLERARRWRTGAQIAGALLIIVLVLSVYPS